MMCCFMTVQRRVQQGALHLLLLFSSPLDGVSLLHCQ